MTRALAPGNPFLAEFAIESKILWRWAEIKANRFLDLQPGQRERHASGCSMQWESGIHIAMYIIDNTIDAYFHKKHTPKSTPFGNLPGI
jgi:hypothetical protein